MKVSWTATENAVSVKQFLLGRGISHNLWQRVPATDRLLMRNGHVATPDEPVNAGDTVVFGLPDEPADARVNTSFEPIDVIYSDDNWIIVNKQPGISSIPGPTNQDTTLLNRIKGWMTAQHTESLVPRLISRIDYDTSGIVLAACNRLVQSMITPQVEQHKLTKTYLALVQGKLDDSVGLIDAPIGRQDDSPKRIVTPDGQMAKTSYEVLATNGDVSLVKLQLLTGRTHQIRVHMSSIGHPLLGDQLYGGATNEISRQALHASELSFTDPMTDEKRSVHAPLPTDMQKVVDRLHLG